MKNKHAIIIGALIVLAIFIAFLLIDSKEPNSHATDNDIVQADNKIIIAQRDAGLKTIDSLKKAVTKRDTIIGELKSELTGYRRDLDKSTAKAVQLAREVKALKDTSAFGRRCDSLATEALNFSFLYEQYKTNSDSLSALVDKNSEDYINAMNAQRRLYDELFEKYEQLYKLYNALYKDHQQAGKKLRREKLKTKVAALLGLVGAGVIILR